MIVAKPAPAGADEWAAFAADPALALVAAHKAAWTRLIRIDVRTADHEEIEKAGRAVDAAYEDLLRTPPTTLAGMRAVIEYMVDCDGHPDYLPTLLRSPVLAG